MNRKAVFLDRDGTINIEKNYLYNIEDFEFISGVIESLKLLQDAGFLLFIITNQSGIARGYYTEKEFNDLNDWMLDFLENRGIHISKVYYCPHLPEAKEVKYRKNCNCRKPALGMYEQAMREFDIDMSESFSIGDKFRDCVVCQTYDCKGFLIGNNESEDVISSVKRGEVNHVKYAEDLYAAVSKIIN